MLFLQIGFQRDGLRSEWIQVYPNNFALLQAVNLEILQDVVVMRDIAMLELLYENEPYLSNVSLQSF